MGSKITPVSSEKINKKGDISTKTKPIQEKCKQTSNIKNETELTNVQQLDKKDNTLKKAKLDISPSNKDIVHKNPEVSIVRREKVSLKNNEQTNKKINISEEIKSK